ncbi:MAG: hypothetical protein KBS74_03805 [Clostridiales bacterium]|nr:hypothetical protein [Candidatus Cacconaster stercorequi]
MELEYTVFDPTENITLLVTSPVPRQMQPQVAGRLLELEPDGEQVGFLEYCGTAQPRLQMMGGEFCGNATMSLGAWLCHREKQPLGTTEEFLLEVSGTDAPVPCSVTPVPHCSLGTVSMPLPEKIEQRTFPFGDGEIELPVVFLPGICHIIAPNGTVQRHQAENALRTWADRLPCQAAGLLLLDQEQMHFDPLVYVKDTGTFVWERGCGSGSAAVGCWFTAMRQADQCLSLKQPGGTIAVVTTWDGSAVTGLSISGTVKIGKTKTVDITI